MNRLPGLQALTLRILTDNDDLLYRHTGTFMLNGFTWADTRFIVKEPDALNPTAIAAATAAAERFNVDYHDIRLLILHPEDTMPAVGASIPWDGGILTIRAWGQAKDFTPTRRATCVLER